MSTTHAQKLTQQRRQEQEVRGYVTSSRWYTGLSNAISFLERAEAGDDALDCFRDAWAAAYNLFMLYGQTGVDEFKRFNSWITEVKEIPAVRRLLSDVSINSPFVTFREHVDRAKRSLLKTQGLQELIAWQGKSVSPDKACRYFLSIIRDLRNTCGHPEFNPNNVATKRALASATECLIPVVVAAIQAMIEHPVPGTTGRTTAYRSFLWPFLKNSDSFFSDYYLERLFPEEELDAFPEEEAKERLKGVAREHTSRRSTLVSADAEGAQ